MKIEDVKQFRKIIRDETGVIVKKEIRESEERINKNTDEKTDKLARMVGRGFIGMEKRINQRFVEQDKRFEEIDKRFDKQDETIEYIAETQERMERRQIAETKNLDEHSRRIKVLEKEIV